MSIRPVASEGATIPTARVRRAGVCWGLCPVTALLLCALPAPRAAAQNAQSVFKKMVSTYSSAKTYQGHIVSRRTGKGQDGRTVSLITTQQIRYKSPNLFYVQTTMNIVGGPAGAPHTQSRTLAADGHSTIAYFPERKQYAKQNTAPAISLANLLQSVLHVNAADASLRPSKTVQGHSAYVIQIKPDLSKLPPNMPPAQRAKLVASIKPVEFLIDRQNYQLLRVTGSAGGTSDEVNLTGQVFNAAIPDSAFHFSPPAGAKQVTPQPGAGAPPGGPPR